MVVTILKMRVKNKIIAIVMLLVMLAGMIFPADIRTMAGEEPYIFRELWFDSDGDAILDIYVNNCKEIGSLSFDVSYNTEQFEYIRYKTEYTVGNTLVSVNENSGTISVAAVTLSGLVTDAILVRLEFEVLASGSVEVAFPLEVTECTDLYTNAVAVTYDAEGYVGNMYFDPENYCGFTPYMIDKNTFSINEVMEVGCRIDNSPGIYSCEYTVIYDANYIEYIRYEIPQYINAMVDVNVVSEGELRVAIASTELIHDMLNLLTLKFIARKEVAQWGYIDYKDTTYVNAQLKEVTNNSYYYGVNYAITNNVEPNIFTISGPEAAKTYDTITVEVAIDDNSGFSAMTLNLNYDASVLKFVEGAVVQGTFSNVISNVSGGNGTVSIAVAAVEDVREDGTFAKITFDVLNVQTQETQLELSMVEFVNSAMEEQACVCGTYALVVERDCAHKETSVKKENGVEATCTEDGSYEEVTICNACNRELSRESKVEVASGHQWGDTWIIDSTSHWHACAQCGEKADFGEHVMDPEEDSVCSVCEKTIGIPGDANGDGNVNGRDVLLLRQYLAGGYDVTIDEGACDVNNDGKVNARDVLLLRQYLAGGYDVELM